MNRHRMSDLLGSLRRLPDPARRPDPLVRALVAQLGTVALPEPRPRFRSELRMQLVAIAPRLVSEATEDSADTVPVSSGTAWRWRWIAHPLRVAAGLVVTAALLLGLGLWASQRALPGDALYSLKRGWESTQLAFTHGTDRGITYLHHATRRADEVSGLLSRASASGRGTVADGLGSRTMSLIESTLDSADSDVREGSRILTDQASAQHSAKPLQILIAWAPAQLSTLQSIEGRLPRGVARDRVVHSISTLTDSATRAKVLAPLATCGCFDTLPSDANGPVPPGEAPAGAPGSPPAPSSPGAPGTSGTVPASTTPGGTASEGSTGETASPDGSGSPTVTETGLPTEPAPPPTSIPSLPTDTSLPTSTALPTSTPLPTSTSLPSAPTDLPTGSTSLPLAS
jgi:hypothetical protein